jgi:glucokinase
LQYVIGGDIGGTNIRFALINRNGKIIKSANAKTPLKRDEIIEKIFQLISSLEEKPLLIAIGGGGIVDFARGVVVNTPNFDFKDVPLQKLVQKQFNVPTILDNDANTAAWGENIFGAAKGVKNFVCVTLGTGIGGGLVIDKKIYRGNFFAAGEIGHTTIGYASDIKALGINADYENVASGNALGILARHAINKDSNGLILKMANGDKKSITGKVVTAAAQKGDETAIELIKRHGEIIGIGLANVANILDPAMFVLTGGLAAAGSLIIPHIEKSLYSHIFAADYRKPQLVQGQLGDDAGVIGAAAMAFYPHG